MDGRNPFCKIIHFLIEQRYEEWWRDLGKDIKRGKTDLIFLWNGLKAAWPENENEVFMIKITKLVKRQYTKSWQIFN